MKMEGANVNFSFVPKEETYERNFAEILKFSKLNPVILVNM